jgi:hypothetical protein
MAFLYELDYMHSRVKAMTKDDLRKEFYFIHAHKYKKPLHKNEYYTSITTV